MTKTIRLGTSAPDIARAADLIRDGALVAFPTETVYGLGADATNDLAVAGIFAAKDRPRFNPLIAHVADLDAAEEIVSFSDRASQIAQAFWPGPLTLVLPAPKDAVSELVTAGLPTLAVRVPAHPVAREILRAVGRPVAAPSANPSGRVSPTTADHVFSGLDGRIAAVIDAGPCSVGLESTIVLPANPPQLLRPGGVPVEEIEALIGQPLQRNLSPDSPLSPGQIKSHYAPEAAIRLNVTHPRADEILLGFGPVDAELNLSPEGDLTAAAANLFGYLRQIDTLADGRAIAVSPIPGTGLGLAINDRLARAAAPR